MPALADDPKFVTNKARVENREELIALLNGVLAERPRAHWHALFEGILPCGPVQSVREAFDDPQARYRGMVKTITHPTVGELKLVGPPVKYSETQARVRTPPPLLGQHTREVLGRGGVLGLSDDAIDGLAARGVVQCSEREC